MQTLSQSCHQECFLGSCCLWPLSSPYYTAARVVPLTSSELPGAVGESPATPIRAECQVTWSQCPWLRQISLKGGTDMTVPRCVISGAVQQAPAHPGLSFETLDIYGALSCDPDVHGWMISPLSPWVSPPTASLRAVSSCPGPTTAHPVSWHQVHLAVGWASCAFLSLSFWPHGVKW